MGPAIDSQISTSEDSNRGPDLLHVVNLLAGPPLGGVLRVISLQKKQEGKQLNISVEKILDGPISR